ncbi:MAG: hypothetical protein H6815_04665 [Phycisphaeraceae bacterium]|nr:hypothetical protein [Phycisphaerales bacterium]MCB9859726.1 hypothetical protein [Phycisphaeraceae bacterium]
MKTSALRTGLCLGILSIASHASAQWTVTNLHPPGATQSGALGVQNWQQVGYATFNGADHAALWMGSATSFVDLHPAGAESSSVNDVHNGQQAGSATFGGSAHASLWTGTSASHVDLHPALAESSEALAVHNGQQGGYAMINGYPRASVWTGTSGSWRDITPAVYDFSVVYGLDDSQHVGSTLFFLGNACVWNDNGTSSTILHSGFENHSSAYDVYSGQQVGYIAFLFNTRACYWNSEFGTQVYLHPNNGIGSVAYSVYDNYQAGWVSEAASQVRHACIWHGSVETWEDISAVLPGSWRDTEARGIWHDGTTLYVVGFGYNNATSRNEALLWSKPLDQSCYADCDNNGTLSVADYLCFGNAYANNDPYADCDGSGLLSVFDYICYGNAYAEGCP